MLLIIKPINMDKKFSTTLNAYKIKKFIWVGPCNKRETALITAPHTGSIKLLIYKETSLRFARLQPQQRLVVRASRK